MTLKKPATARAHSRSPDPPYPLTPEERAQLEQESSESENEWDSAPTPPRPSSAFDRRGELPDMLRVGGPAQARRSAELRRETGVGRSSSELRRDYDRGTVPDALKPGSGGRSPRTSGELQRPGSRVSSRSGGNTPTRRSPYLPATSAPVLPTLQPLSPLQTSVPGSASVTALSPISPTAAPPFAPLQAVMQTGSSSSSSPLAMGANLTSSDRPFSEFSPFYTPGAPADGTRDRGHSVSAPGQERNFSIASTASSAFDPGADLSSFDASFSRAFPGERGAPAVGMDGWKESEQEEQAAKTWEEDLERRARAGAELQRRAEEAQRKEREERLAQEFWDQEQSDWDQQANLQHRVEGLAIGTPPRAPAPLQQTFTGGSNNPWTEQLSTPPRVPPQIPPSSERRPSPISQPPPPTTTTTPPLPVRPPPTDPTHSLYQIKHATILHPSSPTPLRIPILLQNANGPCPLLALINALILTTPSSPSPLYTTLSRLEQISLPLLLSTTIEYLLSFPPPDETPIPDISLLYNFLLTLHSGMNVNPCFLPESLSSSAPSSPGGFQPTPELQLYSVFGIPLIHTWLPAPPPSSPTELISALNRSACTYDDLMTLLAREDALIARLTGGEDVDATEEEKGVLRDAEVVRRWVVETGSQMTQWGVGVLGKWLSARNASTANEGGGGGRVAILFRNDHFATVVGWGSRYQHHLGGEVSGQQQEGGVWLLVTDAGYASMPEIVWERVVDVRGCHNGLFSGDFRPVGGGGGGPSSSSSSFPPPAAPAAFTASSQPAAPASPAGSAALPHQARPMSLPPTQNPNPLAPSTPPRTSSLSGVPVSSGSPRHPTPTTHGQDLDHDLALALQLQEEEERRVEVERLGRERERARLGLGRGQRVASLVDAAAGGSAAAGGVGIGRVVEGGIKINAVSCRGLERWMCGLGPDTVELIEFWLESDGVGSVLGGWEGLRGCELELRVGVASWELGVRHFDGGLGVCAGTMLRLRLRIASRCCCCGSCGAGSRFTSSLLVPVTFLRFRIVECI
ncbi:hypothetical protein EX30DRAFT_222919 [Ascodesmis nigricans]|uniref:MINDY deubiquitinase domain-containing protein n=1 Tax=Ascodesmis nigricans TaxID=341454 RepID=A0A4S2MJ76_9PEZI|nr:hypothetical protein EX30DRAFT_222919 [Ascodesmis nigricans]